MFNSGMNYSPRFVAKSDTAELINLYHPARTALCGQDDSPYRRRLWASQEFANTHPGISSTAAYKDLCGLLGA